MRFVPLALCLLLPACGADSGSPLPAREQPPPAGESVLVARFAQLSDTHVLDALSPARLPGAQPIIPSAWRLHEAYSTQLLDGLIRTINRIHAGGRPIDFVLLTGDMCDNAQSNELEWLLAVLDGRTVAPLSGPDDRPAGQRPPPNLDPYAPFKAQGLYRHGVHGAAPTIPWYVVCGNHDVNAMGVFPIVVGRDGHRTAPLPLDWRPGIILPAELDPTGNRAYGRITPADPGPPELLERPVFVEPNPERAYFGRAAFRAALFSTDTPPPGHGFATVDGPRWYAASPVAGLRLIALDTTDARNKLPGGVYSEGAMSLSQLAFLRDQLEAADAAGELVLVASHHPSASLTPLAGSEVTPAALRRTLAAGGTVVHVAGHTHRNRAWDAGGYVELETCSTLDAPQEGRLVEIWRTADGAVFVSYEMFTHGQEVGATLPPPLDADPLHALRENARGLAGRYKWDEARTQTPAADRLGELPDANPAGEPADRAGRVRIP